MMTKSWLMSKSPSDNASSSLSDSTSSGAFSSLLDNATLAKNYGLLVKATDGVDGADFETSGYVYKELTDLTFENEGRAGSLLAQSLTKRLTAAQDVESKLKTLKTIRHLMQNGSKSFRRSLRCHDEHLKGAADAGMEMLTSTRSVSTADGGNSRGAQVRSIAAEIRIFLFDQSTMEGDDSKEPEQRPQSSLPPGMGSSIRTEGKYEGFGTAPPKETVTDKMLDMVESMLTFPDERREVLEMCLAAPPTGNYTPVDLPALNLPADDGLMVGSIMSLQAGSASAGELRKHVPGRAGGGWESDDDEEEPSSRNSNQEEETSLSVDEVALEACEGGTPSAGSRKSSEPLAEFPPLEAFLRSNGSTLDGVESCFQQLSTEYHTSAVINEMGKQFEVEANKDIPDNNKVLKIILLLEYFLRSDKTNFDEASNIFKNSLKAISMSTHVSQQNVIKAKKVNLIIDSHVRLLQKSPISPI